MRENESKKFLSLFVLELFELTMAKIDKNYRNILIAQGPKWPIVFKLRHFGINVTLPRKTMTQLFLTLKQRHNIKLTL